MMRSPLLTFLPSPLAIALAASLALVLPAAADGLLPPPKSTIAPATTPAADSSQQLAQNQPAPEASSSGVTPPSGNAAAQGNPNATVKPPAVPGSPAKRTARSSDKSASHASTTPSGNATTSQVYPAPATAPNSTIDKPFAGAAENLFDAATAPQQESNPPITNQYVPGSREGYGVIPGISKQPLPGKPVGDSSQTIKESIVEPIELKSTLIKTQDYAIDLPTVLKLIEDQNLLIADSKKNTEILQSRLRQNQVALLPSVSGVYTQSRLTGAQQIFGGDVIEVVRTTVQPQVTASWTLYPGGQNIYQILAAKRRKVSSDYLLKGTIQEQLSQAVQDYYKLLAAYMAKGVVVRTIEQAREQVRLNQLKAQLGNGIPLDLSQAKTSYAQQQSSLVQAESAIVLAEQTLLNRLNLDPTIHLVPSEGDALKKQLVNDEFPLQQLINDALLTNPSLKTSQEELKAMGYDYKVTRGALIPSVTLRAYANKTGPDWSDLFPTHFAGLTVNVDLLENMGLQIPFQMQERKKLIEQKQIQLQALVRDIQSNVTTAYLNSQNAESSIAAAEQEVLSANESYTLAVGRFASGYGINLDVLSAQAAQATARNNLVQATLNYNQAQVQLVQAMGQALSPVLQNGLQAAAVPSAAQTTITSKGSTPNGQNQPQTP